MNEPSFSRGIPPVTHAVKALGTPASLETAVAVHYNLHVSNARISGHLALAILCAPLLMGGACEKKQNKPNDTGAIAALDSAGASGATATSEADTTPLAGVDISKLSADKTKVFYKLVGSLKSPCGKAHSLRVSLSSDTSCKRAPFAVRYIASLLEDEANETQAREEYAKKYEKPPTMVKLDISKAPRAGTSDAPVQLVEFFDYECPHCQVFKAALEQVVGDRPGQVGVAYLMFPLSSHPLSRNAAQAAIAANQLGKFKEMHDKLFAETPRHSPDNILEYAKAIGLDMARFDKAYGEAAAQVSNDLKQGEEAGVEATPTLYFNNRKYEGPMYPKYLGMWIDEEIAVNR
jgi:protein-disulfide isomerase